MSEKNTKLIRKQLTNAVKAMLPEVFNAETTKAMEKVLILRMDSRLSEISIKVQTALDNMDQRSKDLQSYVVRNTGVIQAPVTTTAEVTPPSYSPTDTKALEDSLSQKADDASLS